MGNGNLERHTPKNCKYFYIFFPVPCQIHNASVVKNLKTYDVKIAVTLPTATVELKPILGLV